MFCCGEHFLERVLVRYLKSLLTTKGAMYMDILQKHFLPYWKKKLVCKYLFQYDNDEKYVCKLAKQWLSQKKSDLEIVSPVARTESNRKLKNEFNKRVRNFNYFNSAENFPKLQEERKNITKTIFKRLLNRCLNAAPQYLFLNISQCNTNYKCCLSLLFLLQHHFF